MPGVLFLFGLEAACLAGHAAFDTGEVGCDDGVALVSQGLQSGGVLRCVGCTWVQRGLRDSCIHSALQSLVGFAFWYAVGIHFGEVFRC